MTKMRRLLAVAGLLGAVAIISTSLEGQQTKKTGTGTTPQATPAKQVSQLADAVDSRFGAPGILTYQPLKGDLYFALQLKPKGSSGQFKRLDLVLARQGYALQRLVIVDAFDNQTELSFTNLKINPKLAASEFSFQVPAGVTVVRADGL